ncbi:MAG: hypothetical protein NZO16_02765 [Deltaproteobacteria bacterium]|nr:hypothetical protein [Deltaproteobacteria bacterium]
MIFIAEDSSKLVQPQVSDVPQFLSYQRFEVIKQDMEKKMVDAVWIEVDESGVLTLSDQYYEDLVSQWHTCLPAYCSVIGLFYDSRDRNSSCLLLPRSTLEMVSSECVTMRKQAVIFSDALTNPEKLRPVVIVSPWCVATTQNGVCGDKLYELHLRMNKFGGYRVFNFRERYSLVDLVLNIEGCEILEFHGTGWDKMPKFISLDNKRLSCVEMHGLYVCGIVRMPNDPLPPSQTKRFYRLVNGEVVFAKNYADAIKCRLSRVHGILSCRPSPQINTPYGHGFLSYEFLVSQIGGDSTVFERVLRQARNVIKWVERNAS